MIARLNGQIVLVGGAIPGERGDRPRRARRQGRRLRRHGQRRPIRRRIGGPWPPILCAADASTRTSIMPRQLDIKAQVIADAFGRIGRLTLPSAVRVAPSPEDGYRMRARLHVRGRRAGFFREGTHDLCDARQTRQLLPATCDVLDDDQRRSRFARRSRRRRSRPVRECRRVGSRCLRRRRSDCGGAGPRSARRYRRGDRRRTERVGHRPSSRSTARRRSRSGGTCGRSFRATGICLNDLVDHVVGLVPPGGDLLDLYAGSGLFSVTAAAARRARVTAVEGDGIACGDLTRNASAHASVAVHHQPVEEFLDGRRRSAGCRGRRSAAHGPVACRRSTA